MNRKPELQGFFLLSPQTPNLGIEWEQRTLSLSGTILGNEMTEITKKLPAFREHIKARGWSKPLKLDEVVKIAEPSPEYTCSR